MALNVPDVGENKILEMIVNKTAAENLVFKLFKNNITPADTDTAATYTESTFPGYGSVTMAGADWNAAASGTITSAAQKTITCSGAAAESVYGYFVVQLTSGVLIWSERDTNAPFAISQSGDAVKFTPSISAN